MSSVALGDGHAVPDQVKKFIDERAVCEHFRGEPYEGNNSEQRERRAFIADSLDIFCAGTDKRLAALKRRYKNDPAVMKLLNQYEQQIE